MAYYDPLTGMVKQGDGPQTPTNNTSVGAGHTGGSINGASQWSPWPGQQPGSYESGFEANNYKPHVPYWMDHRQKPSVIGNTQQVAPPISPGTGGTTPWTPGVPASPSQPVANIGVADINTGIKSGLLPNSAIETAISRLGQLGPSNLNQIPGINLNAQQASEIAGNNANAMTRGIQSSQSDLSRDAAYQQAQMAQAYQRAQGNASLAGMGVAGGMYENGVNRGLQAGQLQLSLLGSLLGGL